MRIARLEAWTRPGALAAISVAISRSGWRRGRSRQHDAGGEAPGSTLLGGAQGAAGEDQLGRLGPADQAGEQNQVPPVSTIPRLSEGRAAILKPAAMIADVDGRAVSMQPAAEAVRARWSNLPMLKSTVGGVLRRSRLVWGGRVADPLLAVAQAGELPRRGRGRLEGRACLFRSGRTTRTSGSASAVNGCSVG